ncbi:hypothetical protein FQR65_LT20071 [Abscondita terminalis]|nr:hypothetical protein FQR65_LT20071 [Abscondita terminalis]
MPLREDTTRNPLPRRTMFSNPRSPTVVLPTGFPGNVPPTSECPGTDLGKSTSSCSDICVVRQRPVSWRAAIRTTARLRILTPLSGPYQPQRRAWRRASHSRIKSERRILFPGETAAGPPGSVVETQFGCQGCHRSAAGNGLPHPSQRAHATTPLCVCRGRSTSVTAGDKSRESPREVQGRARRERHPHAGCHSQAPASFGHSRDHCICLSSADSTISTHCTLLGTNTDNVMNHDEFRGVSHEKTLIPRGPALRDNPAADPPFPHAAGRHTPA